MPWKHSQREFHVWAAGAFETGGSITGTRVSLQTLDREIAEDLQRAFGGGYRSKGLPGTYPATTAYTWSLTTRSEIQRFLQTIMPFLHPKRTEEARNVLSALYEREKAE